MKYWVYKNSRIHGPFDKDAFAGFPGVDAATLVSAGESAASAVGGWQPAGEVSDLAGIALETGPRWPQDEPPSTYGLLDKLQIESAGLVDDSDFPGASLDVFQDAEQRKNFADLLNPRLAAAEAELRRSKDRVSEFTTLLEKLYKRVAELESSQTDLMHRLAAKEAALRLQQPPTMTAAVAPPVAAAPVAAPPVVAPSAVEIPVIKPPVIAPLVAEAPAAAAPVVAPPVAIAPIAVVRVAEIPVVEALVAAAPVAAPPVVAPPVVEIPVAKPPVVEPLVVEAPVAAVPVAVPPVVAPPVAEALVAEVPVAEPPVVAPPVVEAPVEATPAAEAAAPKKAAYPKALHFKVVPTVRSFRVASPDAPVEPRPAAPAPAPAPVSAAVPAPAPVPLQPPVSVPTPAPVEAFVAAPVIDVVALPTIPAAEPMAAPTSVAEPVFEDMAGASASTPAPAPTQAPAAEPPATMSFAWGGQPEAPATPPPSTQEVLARLAKPASTPQTAPPPRQARSNKPFLVAGAALVALLGAIGYFILHQPKDLNQMVSLDDSREHLGAQPADDSAPPPPAKPKAAEESAPTPAPTPAPEPAPEQPAAAAPPAAGDSGARPAAEAELDAAVALVKDFPLDGGRGTVAHWLQYSYNASPDAGKETWSASSTGGQGYLVEYRFTPTARGGEDVHYLFAADMSMGLIFGKNLEAQRMLAGSAPREADENPRAKTKTKTKAKTPRPAARRAAKRAVASESAKEVPLMPLPNEGDLTPPAEDAAAFGADTVNPGL